MERLKFSTDCLKDSIILVCFDKTGSVISVLITVLFNRVWIKVTETINSFENKVKECLHEQIGSQNPEPDFQTYGLDLQAGLRPLVSRL